MVIIRRRLRLIAVAWYLATCYAQYVHTMNSPFFSDSQLILATEPIHNRRIYIAIEFLLCKECGHLVYFDKRSFRTEGLALRIRYRCLHSQCQARGIPDMLALRYGQWGYLGPWIPKYCPQPMGPSVSPQLTPSLIIEQDHKPEINWSPWQPVHTDSPNIGSDQPEDMSMTDPVLFKQLVQELCNVSIKPK